MRRASMNFAMLAGILALLLALAVSVAPYANGGGPAPARPTDARSDPFIVPTSWLAVHLNDSSLVLIQVGPQEIFDKRHIPGAQYLSLNDISTPHGQGLTLELPPVAQLVSAFEKIGVSDDSRIVLYTGNDWVTATGRTFMTLDFLGLAGRASILDGGLPAWQEQGLPITKDVKKIARGSITPHPRQDVVVDAAWLSAHLNQPSIRILDARNTQFYSGADSGEMPRAGHIPGATNIPFTSLLDDSDKFKDAAALGEMFRAAGAKPGDTVVTYCHIGLQASLLYFVARSLGYDARLYDGSWEDWSARKELPVETAVAASH